MISNNISFVIPCYRSEHTICNVVEELINTIKDLSVEKYEIILVNDCSPDGVWNKIKAMCNRNRNIKGISLARNFGQHAALLAGYSIAIGDIVVSLDDDGQTPIDELNLIIEKINEGYDAVYAYYDEIKQKGFRKFGSYMASKMGQIMIGFPKDFKGSSFYAARGFVIEEMIKYDNPYPYLAGLVFRTTHNITGVLTHQRKRAYGSSGYSFAALLKLWLNGFTAFSVKPIRLGAISGMVLSLVGLIVAAALIIKKLIYPEVTMGWTSTVSAILVVGGLILAMLGLVGEYVGRIYISINNSPQYVIKEIVDRSEDEFLMKG